MIDYTALLEPEVLSRFGVRLPDAELKYSSHSYVYVFPEDIVIRVHAGRKEPVHCQDTEHGELDFMADCMKTTSAVCGPVESGNGRLVENFCLDDIWFSVSCFKKANGHTLENPELTEEHMRILGRTLALIHKTGISNGKHYAIPTWEERIAPTWNCFEKGEFNSLLTTREIETIRNTRKAVEGLPILNGENYGVIHGDFSFFNYYIDNGNINIFDFGDCHYGFFMYDIATAFVYSLMWKNTQSSLPVPEFAALLLKAFRSGYESCLTLPPNEWEKFHLFMKYRLVVMILATLNNQKNSDNVAGTQDSLKRLKLLTTTLCTDNIMDSLEEKAKRTRTIVQRIKSILQSGTLDLPENADIKALLSSEELKPFLKSIIPDN